MRWRAAVLACLVALAFTTSPAEAEDIAPAAQQAFLRTRDAAALLATMQDTGGGGAWRGLVWLAADRLPPTPTPGATGVEAMAEVVLALRGVDLTGAESAQRRAREGGG
ncbi:MAG: hypothetical protein O2894_12210, partial [Planctomycetota bacterium]|nr:hypothetical protein [Planctomycetota bacterium]